MAKGAYVGVVTDVPIYTEESKDLDLTYLDQFFSYTTGSTAVEKWTISNQSGGGIKLVPGNFGDSGKSKTATITLTAKQNLTNVKITGEYHTEQSYDKITLTVAGTTVINEATGSSSAAQRWSGSLASGKTIVLKYAKDGSTNGSNETDTFFAITCDPVTVRVENGHETKSVARKVKKMYVGVGGKAREVTAGYVGVGGKAKLCFGGVDKGFDYTGKWEKWTGFLRDGVTISGKHATIYALTTSGTLTLRRTAGVWLLGGGASGMSGCVPSQTSNTTAKIRGGYLPGNGGGSGYITETTLSAGSYPVTIGQGGKGSQMQHTFHLGTVQAGPGQEVYTHYEKYVNSDNGDYFTEIYSDWGNDGGDTTVGSYTAKGGQCKGNGGSGGGGAGWTNVVGSGSGKKFTAFGQDLHMYGLTYYHGGGGGAGYGESEVWGDNIAYAGGGAGWNGNKGILGTDTSDEDLTNYTHASSGRIQGDSAYGGMGGANYGQGEGGGAYGSGVYDANEGSNATKYGCGGGGGAGNYRAKSQKGGDGYQGLVLIAVMDE